eukprot:9742821-Ditylum_brightwellii.AAC.1
MHPTDEAILECYHLGDGMPCAVIHGSNLYGGFEFACLFFEQGMSATEQLIRHLRENVITGQLQMLNSQVQLVSGSADLYLKDMDFDYVPNTHITRVQHFLQLCGGAI